MDGIVDVRPVDRGVGAARALAFFECLNGLVNSFLLFVHRRLLCDVIVACLDDVVEFPVVFGAFVIEPPSCHKHLVAVFGAGFGERAGSRGEGRTGSCLLAVVFRV